MLDQNLIKDPDYQDFRELICFERPACVWLHHEHDVRGLRFLLADRILFRRQAGKLSLLSNDLDSFLRSHGVVEELQIEIEIEIETEPETKPLPSNFTGDALTPLEIQFRRLFVDGADALLVTYGNNLAGQLLLSTWMVEYAAESGWQVTSLRGDDFYVRRFVRFEDLAAKLHVENSKIAVQVLRFSKNILSHSGIPEDEFLRLFNIDSKLERIRDRLNELRLEGEVVGSEALIAQFNGLDLNPIFLAESVNAGFKNILLVKVFWPLQFFYQPFLVFIRRYLNAIESTDEAQEILSLLQKVSERTEILTSLGAKFAVAPQEKTLVRFKLEMESILLAVSQIEDTFFLRYPNRRRALHLAGRGGFSRSLAPLIKDAAQHIVVSQFSQETAMSICLADKMAVEIADSTYRGKDQVREQLFSSEFAIRFKTFRSFDEVADEDFPAILKSSRGWASGYVFHVQSKEDSRRAFAKISQMHRLLFKGDETAACMLEEVLTGKEYAAEVRVSEDEVQILGIFEKRETPDADLLDYAYVYRWAEQAELKNRFNEKIQKLIKHLSIRDGFLHIEFKAEDLSFSLIEINFRLGGAGLLASVIFEASGINALSKRKGYDPTGVGMPQSAAQAFLVLIPRVDGGGLISSIRGRQSIEAEPSLRRIIWMKGPGDLYSPPPLGFDYPAATVSAHDDENDMQTFIDFVAQNLGFDYV